MQWKQLLHADELTAIGAASNSVPQVIFKHSPRCSISVMALGRLERSAAPTHCEFYMLNVLEARPASNAVAELYRVHHESPQLLLIKNGECTYDASHAEITMADLQDAL